MAGPLKWAPALKWSATAATNGRRHAQAKAGAALPITATLSIAAENFTILRARIFISPEGWRDANDGVAQKTTRLVAANEVAPQLMSLI